MSALRDDPLLGVARLLIGFTIGLLAIVAAAMALLVVAGLTFKHDFLVAELASQGVPDQGLTVVIAIVALVTLLCVLGIFFLRHLQSIVRSVGAGDPFNPTNADRLRAMGWLTLASQPVVWLISAAVHWIERYTGKANLEFELSIGAIILAVTLFILARVFRSGAAMRDELEGTV